jgi:hypothetical protein
MYDDVRVSTERLTSRLAADITIIKGLHFKPSVSYLMEDYRYMLMRKAPLQMKFSLPRKDSKNEATINFRQIMTDQILQYDFNIKGDHKFHLTGWIQLH